jgi:3-hydroxyisobutyrate dehydrogenase-like beta-hydroxyacid dehydrogenase
MGRPMVSRLVQAGHQVRALGRTAGARSELDTLGARAVADPAAVADAADLVIVCVFTDEQVQEVCLGGELTTAMPRGSVLALHTTGSPRTAQAIAVNAAPDEVDVVDAPVSGGPHDIAAGRLTLFMGGTKDAVARVRPTLASYGDPILHVGPVGAGQRMKLVNNTIFAAQIGVVAEAIRLGTELGLPESTMLEALPHASGSSRALSGIAARGSVASFVEIVGGFVGKDIEVVRKITAELGADLGPLDEIVNAINSDTVPRRSM